VCLGGWVLRVGRDSPTAEGQLIRALRQSPAFGETSDRFRAAPRSQVPICPARRWTRRRRTASGGGRIRAVREFKFLSRRIASKPSMTGRDQARRSSHMSLNPDRMRPLLVVQNDMPLAASSHGLPSRQP